MTVFIYGFWFWCGFIAAMLLIALIVSLPKWASKAGRDEMNTKLFKYWEDHGAMQMQQIAVLRLIADKIDKHDAGSSNKD